jgi:hypothetical protein
MTIKTLTEMCKGPVYVEVNLHKSAYETVEEHIEEIKVSNGILPEKETLKKMVEADTIIEIQCYPDTPNAFYKTYHWDIDLAIEEMIKTVKEGRL